MTKLDIFKLMSLMESRADDPILIRYLEESGIKLEDELELPDGEFNAYVERPDQGYALVFTDEAVLLGDLNAPIGLRPLRLSGIFLYLSEIEDYKPFDGVLPFGLPRLLIRQELTRVLGHADWQRIGEEARVTAESWNVDTARRVHATYQSDGEHVSVLSISRPDAQPTT